MVWCGVVWCDVVWRAVRGVMELRCGEVRWVYHIIKDTVVHNTVVRRPVLQIW